MVEISHPDEVLLPDLSALDPNLMALGMLLAAVGALSDVEDGALGVLTLFRTTESALKCYERSRLLFASPDGGPNGDFWSYLRGLTEMELTLMALDRAMRVAEKLVGSRGTTIRSKQIPSQAVRDRVRLMRNGIDHVDERLRRVGTVTALWPDRDEMTIEDPQGTPLVLSYEDLADALRKLHTLASDLIANPANWLKKTTPPPAQ